MNSIIYFVASFLIITYKAFIDSCAEKQKCILKGWFKAGMFWSACVMIGISIPDEISLLWLFYCSIITSVIYIGFYNFLFNKFLKIDPFYISEKDNFVNKTILKIGIHPLEARLFCVFVSIIWFIYLILQNSL